MIKVSMLTVSRSEDNLKVLLNSVVEAIDHNDWELLCSWNGDSPSPSHDDKRIKFHRITPYNFSKNNNQLAAKAVGEVLVFINDDMQLDPGSITNAIRALKSELRPVIVGARLRYPSGLIQHAGMYIDGRGMPYHDLKGKCSHDDPRVLSRKSVPAVTGAFMAVRRTEFNEVRFDESCDVAAQDVILCLRMREKFGRDVIYEPRSSAIHFENQTRKLFDQRTTPKGDLDRMSAEIDRNRTSIQKMQEFDHIRLRVITEKPGWIMHRKGEEIAKRLNNCVINSDYPDANVHYYINYGYFQKRPVEGLVVANFTHFDPKLHADKWEEVAKEADHCVAVSQEAARNVRRFGISDEKITVIKVGADVSFRPKMTLGLVGRVYAGGRKGEHLVSQLLADSELMQDLQIVAINDSWGVPVRHFEDIADFYRSIDYLLVPSLIEGGPVPFMEALAVGTMSIAPPIGVIPEFPHISYRTGDFKSLRSVVAMTKNDFLTRKGRLSRYMSMHNWATWSLQHLALFDRLLRR